MKPARPLAFKQVREEGFTLTELLVVMVTVGILGVLLLPLLAGTKPSSQAFQCLENQRQMVLAWQMYSDDNGSKIAPNAPQGTGPGGPATLPTPSNQPCWVAGVMQLPPAGSSTESTNTAMLIDHVQYPNGAFLGPYIKTANPFKCPTDQSVSVIYGHKFPRCRSISMNNFLGSPAQAINSGAKSPYAVYPKVSGLKSAALTFVFLDEREDSINDGVFFTSVDNLSNIIDIPANRHNSAAGFSFADGHTEMHQWISADLRVPIQPTPINNMPVNAANQSDADWLCQHAIGANNFP